MGRGEGGEEGGKGGRGRMEGEVGRGGMEGWAGAPLCEILNTPLWLTYVQNILEPSFVGSFDVVGPRNADAI